MLKTKTLLYGHQDFVRSLAVCPNKHTTISGSNDHTIRTWDHVRGFCDRVLMGHDSTINSLSVMNNNNLIISGGADHTVRIWDTRNPIGSECVHMVSHVSDVHDVTCWNDLNTTSDENYKFGNEFVIYSVGQDMKLNIWDLRKMSSSNSTQHSNVNSFGFSNDHFHYSNSVMSGQQHSFGNTNNYYGIGSSFGVMTNDTSKQSKVSSISTNFGTPFCCQVGILNHEQVIFVGAKNGMLQALSLNEENNSYQVLKSYEGHCGDVSCLSFNVENSTLISGDSGNMVHVFNIYQETPLQTLKDHSDSITCCQILGNSIFTGSKDGTIREYEFCSNNDDDSSSQQLQCSPKRCLERLSMQVFSIAVGRNRLLFCGSDEEPVRCWDVSSS